MSCVFTMPKIDTIKAIMPKPATKYCTIFTA
jgi:hypothetical protein